MATKKKAKPKARAKAKAKPKAKAAKPAKKKVSFTAPGYHTVTAGLNVADASSVIAFCKDVLGAKVSQRVDTPSGKVMHALLQVGDSAIMVSDAVRDPVRTAALCVYVPNVDKTYDKALKAGASPVMPPTDMLWGDRVARVTDSQGNLWHIATHVEDLTLAQIKKRAIAFAAQQAQPAQSGTDQLN